MFDISKLPIKNYLIIGSYALGNRVVKDIDVICYREDINDSEIKIDYEDEYTVLFEFNNKKIECLLVKII